MADSTNLINQINIAFDSVNVEEFVRLIKANPQYLLNPDGTDRWMWLAAQKGNLPMVQALVGLGLDVNIRQDIREPDEINLPFVQIEGPILQAAAKGRLELVHWLLDHGAKINFNVQGKTRSLPLIHAAMKGHLEVVKLLVERGAELNTPWTEANALSKAIEFGRKDVAAYLRSVGAKTVEEVKAGK